MSTAVRPLLLASLAIALAQPVPARPVEGFAARTFDPAPAGDRFLAVPDAGTEGHLLAAAALDLGWARKPLVLRIGGAVAPDGELIRDQVDVRLGLSLALWNRLRLDLSAPWVAAQSGQSPLPSLPPASGAALEDVRLGARATLLRGERLSVGAAVALWLPTGDVARFASDGTVRAEPSILASGRTGRLAYAGGLGALLRRPRTALFTEVGPALDYRAAAAWLLLDDRMQLGPELHGRYQPRGARTSSLEALAAVRWALSPRWSISAALGTRLGPDAPGAAPLRALVRLGWSGAAAAPARLPLAAAGPAPIPPQRPAAVEEPPAAPAPEPAPPALEPAAAAPAPAAVPAAAPGPTAAKRPPPSPVEVAFSTTRLLIREVITFDIGTADLQGSSEAILDAVAGALLDAPRITLVTVEGHTDAMGRRTANLALSLRRAQAVREQLLLRGIDPGRLRAVGAGPDRPVGDNQTAAGREANRRVDFVITAAEGR